MENGEEVASEADPSSQCNLKIPKKASARRFGLGPCLPLPQVAQAQVVRSIFDEDLGMLKKDGYKAFGEP